MVSHKQFLVTSGKLVFLFALAYLIFRSVDLAKFAATIRSVRIPYFVLPGLLFVLGLLAASQRLSWLLAGYRMPMPFRSALRMNWIASFYGNFLPTSVGGDVYRLLALSRKFPHHPAQSVSAVILDRGLGLLSMIVVGGLASFFAVRVLQLRMLQLVIVYAIAVAFAGAAFWILYFPHGIRLPTKGKNVLLNRLANGLNVLISYPDKNLLALAFVVALLHFVLSVASMYCLFLAFGQHVSGLVLGFAMAVIGLAGVVPISINGLGITEGLGIALFSNIGYEAEVILSIFLSARVLLLLFSLTGGIGLLWPRNTAPVSASGARE